MSQRTNFGWTWLCLPVAAALGAGTATAQQAAPTPSAGQSNSATPTAQEATKAARAPATAVDDAARKSEILASSRWRRAMFELNEWLLAQRIYTPEQVAKIKADFSRKVQAMSADDLKFMLADMEAKFKILETPQAQDARAWLAQYLSILADKKREEVISKLPNLATMSADQLRQEIARIDERRQGIEQQQQTMQQVRASAPNPWTQNTKMAEQAYVHDHTEQVGYSSPYRASSGQRPFADFQQSPGFNYYTTGYGGFGLVFGGF